MAAPRSDRSTLPTARLDRHRYTAMLAPRWRPIFDLGFVRQEAAELLSSRTTAPCRTRGGRLDRARGLMARLAECAPAAAARAAPAPAVPRNPIHPPLQRPV